MGLFNYLSPFLIIIINFLRGDSDFWEAFSTFGKVLQIIISLVISLCIFSVAAMSLGKLIGKIYPNKNFINYSYIIIGGLYILLQIFLFWYYDGFATFTTGIISVLYLICSAILISTLNTSAIESASKYKF